MGNTYSIPAFSIPCLETKSLAVSSRRFNQSFLYYKKIDPSSRNRDERHSFRGTTRNSPKRRAFRMQTHPRPLTQSRGQLYFSFKRQLLGESPALHASGSHHPALSDSANQHKAAHSTLFPYRLHISIYGENMQAFFSRNPPKTGNLLTKARGSDMVGVSKKQRSALP